MEYGERKGSPRIFIDGLQELAAVRIIVDALGQYTETLENISDGTQGQIQDTVRTLGDSGTVMAEVLGQTRLDRDNRFSFGQPYLGYIELAVATFEQHPDVLQPHMTADDFMAAQIFFPPTPPETLEETAGNN